MSAIKARAALLALGLTPEDFAALYRALTDHADAPRGVQLNGHCSEDACDHVPASPKCRAWHRLCALMIELRSRTYDRIRAEAAAERTREIVAKLRGLISIDWERYNDAIADLIEREFPAPKPEADDAG